MSTARTTKKGAAADPLQKQMDAAERLARVVAGEDDEQFMLVFQSLVNVLDGFTVRPAAESASQARSILQRTAELPPTRSGRGPGAVDETAKQVDFSIFSDPVFLANAKTLIPDRKRIVGGIPTSEYQDCVAIGSDTEWCCTGTLIAPNVVVTAGHCVADGCASRIFIGDDVSVPGKGTVIAVQRVESHPEYDPQTQARDLAVLILAEDADCKPRRIVSGDVLNAAATVRLAGYGNTDIYSSGGYGKRRMVDVPIASADPRFGADDATEFVAGAPFLDRDSCNGDSGGPAFVQSKRTWYLAGATSRATASTVRPCGDGGIYTRLDVFGDWVRSVPGGHWA